MRKRISVATIILSLVAALVVGGLTYYRWKHPYGRSHCCSVAMVLALHSYANDNGGYFPAGESSPEASLSLLYRSGHCGEPGILRGMTASDETVRRILEGGGLLGPDTCGWHYVEGLTYAGDGRIALLWPKVALGHNGQRTKDGGRQVIFMGGDIRTIPGGEWDAFLAEQEQLLADRKSMGTAGVSKQ